MYSKPLALANIYYDQLEGHLQAHAGCRERPCAQAQHLRALAVEKARQAFSRPAPLPSGRTLQPGNA